MRPLSHDRLNDRMEQIIPFRRGCDDGVCHHSELARCEAKRRRTKQRDCFRSTHDFIQPSARLAHAVAVLVFLEGPFDMDVVEGSSQSHHHPLARIEFDCFSETIRAVYDRLGMCTCMVQQRPSRDRNLEAPPNERKRVCAQSQLFSLFSGVHAIPFLD